MFGRHDSADVTCEHPSLSRLHAALNFEGMTGRCLVTDLGSTHGTFVDGKKLEKVRHLAVTRRRAWGCNLISPSHRRCPSS